MKNKAAKTGNFLIAAGMLMIAGCAVLFWQNLQEDRAAEAAAESGLHAVQDYIRNSASEEQENLQKEEEPVYYGDDLMPEAELLGDTYIGYLSIPSVGLQLPVIKECTAANMKQAPCLYSGALQTKDLVICGHNYKSSFGKLWSVSCGEYVTFTAMNGEEYNYQIGEIEVLEANEVEHMTVSQWPLTLYTCTYNGRQRVTVRCGFCADNIALETETTE